MVMSKQQPTLQQMIDEPTNKIHFWRTSTDVVAPSSSPHSYKGTARHLLITGGHEDAKEHCPRCNDEWGNASNGVRPCLTRGCYTWIEADYAQAGWKFTPIMDETPSPHHIKQFNHETVLNLYHNNLQSRATQNLNNLSSTGDNMSDPRDIESDLPPPMFASEDTPPPMVDDTPPPMEATHSPQDNTKNMEEKT